jgi:8-oxo-dGTP pyrophosphatase MutT (NUDIX family)
MAFRIREYRAAGGVVIDNAGRVLLIERWVLRGGQPAFEIRLPKGHVEAGETDQQAAVRETCEETGYCDVEVIADLGEYLNEFILPDERVLRHEHFYLMRLTDTAPGEPHFDSANADEARFRPRWAENLAEAESLITFGSEREFIARARKLDARLPEAGQTRAASSFQ